MAQLERKIQLLESKLKKTLYEKKPYKVSNKLSFLCNHKNPFYVRFFFDCCKMSFPCCECHNLQCKRGSFFSKKICGFCGIACDGNSYFSICKVCLRNQDIKSEDFGKKMDRSKNSDEKYLCRHKYPKYVLLKFQCCDDNFPCQLCHDLETNHAAEVMKGGSICGFCQRCYIWDKDFTCFGCRRNLTIKNDKRKPKKISSKREIPAGKL